MEYSVEIYSPHGRKVRIVKKGYNLRKLLIESGYDVYSPCGGKGICGKCAVYIKGVGSVTSCLYNVEDNISVVLPEKREIKILSSQYDNTIQVSLDPGNAGRLVSYPLGLAIDIGTTTIVYYILDLLSGSVVATRSEMNPQATFGADVISRIDYCINNICGLAELQKLVVDSINRQIGIFTERTGVNTSSFTRITIAGNTTMMHLLAGVAPKSIALAPFEPQFTEHRILSGADIGINCNSGAGIHLLPSVSGYIGSDIVAGVASIDSNEMKRYLFIDIGTNGEMALVTNEKIWCCATAAGPAFEGANISCGTGAFEGAISNCMDGKIVTISNVNPIGICGSGLIDIIANMLKKEIITEDGTINEPFVVSPAINNGIESDIVITQQDIREVQLAKGAIAAGISILLEKSGYEYDDIDTLVLAGGFGNYMDIDNAIAIGLLPVEMIGKIIQIGNAAGTGALLSLKSDKFISSLNDLIGKTSYIELSYEDSFPEKFALNMNFKQKSTN